MKQRMCYQIITGALLALAITATPLACARAGGLLGIGKLLGKGVAKGWKKHAVKRRVRKVPKTHLHKKTPVQRVPRAKAPSKSSSHGDSDHLGKLTSLAYLATIVGEAGAAEASEFEYNDNGAVFQEEGETIYLGKACDAYSPAYGVGEWGWNKEGWIVVMENDTEQTAFEYEFDNLPHFSQQVLENCAIDKEE